MNIQKRLQDKIKELDRIVVSRLSGLMATNTRKRYREREDDYYDQDTADLRELLEDALVEINKTPMGSTKWR